MPHRSRTYCGPRNRAEIAHPNRQIRNRRECKHSVPPLHVDLSRFSQRSRTDNGDSGDANSSL